MKHLRRLLAVFVLACALTLSAYAGDIDCGRTSMPPASDKVSTFASTARGDCAQQFI
jgi:hypothetical protein